MLIFVYMFNFSLYHLSHANQSCNNTTLQMTYVLMSAPHWHTYHNQLFLFVHHYKCLARFAPLPIVSSRLIQSPSTGLWPSNVQLKLETVICVFFIGLLGYASGVNQSDVTTHCHVYAHSFIAKLFLKEFGSNRVSCRTYFMTVLDVHHIRSDNLSFRTLALLFFHDQKSN